MPAPATTLVPPRGRLLLEAGVQSKYYVARFEIDHHRGLDRALDLLLVEPITYNPVF